MNTIEPEIVDTAAMAAQSQQRQLANPLSNAASVQEILGQVALIQNVMAAVMKENEHYGRIPGCGDKPALLKPGAEKLGFTFRLAPEFQEVVSDIGNGHREYRIKCSLFTIAGHSFVGQGLGSASTMEGKWRFRTGPKKPTGKPVPREYWEMRASEPAKAQAMIGGKGFGVSKGESGGWEICEQGEKVEHDNPADYYNTVLKMAKKRAHVDAILTATAASDIFVQDVEEMVADGLIEPKIARPNGARATPVAEVPEDQQKAKAIQALEDLAQALGFTGNDVAAYLRANKVGGTLLLAKGETLADLPLPRLHWFIGEKNWPVLAAGVDSWLRESGENDLPGIAGNEPPTVEAEASAKMQHALDKRTEGHLETHGVLKATSAPKPTAKDGKRYGCKIDEAWYNTFDSKVGDLMAKLKGAPVRVVYQTSQYGNDIITLEAV